MARLESELEHFPIKVMNELFWVARVPTRIALITLSISILLSGLAPVVLSQNATTHHTASPLTKSADSLLKRGQQRFRQQDYRGAIRDFNQAQAQNPNNADIYFSRGLVLLELGDQLGALWDFDDAIALTPRHAQAYFHRGGIRLGNRNRSGALQDLQVASKLFSLQGDRVRYQKAQNLIRHFNPTVEQEQL